MRSKILMWIGCGVFLGGCLLASPAQAAGWKAGTARVAITPKSRCGWPATRSRTTPSEGAVHDLWAKALVLEDPTGASAVLVTLDICGIDREPLDDQVRDASRQRIRARSRPRSSWPARTRTAARSSART